MSHCLTLNNRFQNVMKHRWVLSKRRRGFAPCLKHEVFSSYGETPLYVSLLQNIEQATAKHYSVKMGHVRRNEISYTTATNTTTRSDGATIQSIWSAESLGQGSNNSAFPNNNNNNSSNNYNYNNNNSTQNRNNQSSSSFGGGQSSRSVGFNDSTVAAIQSIWKF